MATLEQLHTAIMKGQVANVKKIASELTGVGVDISTEIDFAERMAAINKGASFQKIAELLRVM